MRLHVTWGEFDRLTRGEGHWAAREQIIAQVFGDRAAMQIRRCVALERRYPELVPHPDGQMPPERLEDGWTPDASFRTRVPW